LVTEVLSARIAVLLFSLTLIIVFPPVHADSGAYVIPLEGARWSSSTIQVYISGGEEWQQNQTLQAMQLWNQAQLWFANEYFPNSSVYTFEVGDSSAPVQVTLLNSSTVVDNILGWTDYHKQNGVIDSVNVRIAASNSAHALLVLSSHELGHVLGLGDDVICCKKDLMNAFPIVNNVSALPTTLDLYALHILAIANAIPSFVWLSNGIPYETALATPRFSGSPTMLAIRVLEDPREGSTC
jgi:hypothetical protein